MTASISPVALRPLAPEDAGVIAGWAADREFCRHADWTVDLPPAEARRFHEALIQAPPPDLIRLGAIHDGRLVGYVDLHGDQPRRRELGFLIGERRLWGRGLGFLAAAAGLDHGFTNLGLEVVWAEALDANQRSVRILRRLGFEETGRGEEESFLDQPSYNRRFDIDADAWARGLT